MITTPFHPAYLTRDLTEKVPIDRLRRNRCLTDPLIICQAKNLKLCVTAGVGSGHIGLDADKHRFTNTSGANFAVTLSRPKLSTIRSRSWKCPGPTSLQWRSTS